MICGAAVVTAGLFVALVGCGSGVPGESSAPATTPSVPLAAVDQVTATTSAGGMDPSVRRAANGTGREESPLSLPASSLAPRAARLAVPDWIQTALRHPDEQVRLLALDRWAQQAPTGSVDPLMQALEDKDEQVQARALELLVQDWAREQERGGGE